MDSPESNPLAAPLAKRVGKHASATQIADAMVATWHDIAQALTPIIGSKGVAALYKRSLCLAGSAHPWLANPLEDAQAAIDLEALKAIIARQTSSDATLGGNAFLQTFYQLLGSLVGPSLTERLLRSVWADSLSGPPAQDSTP